MRTPHADDLPEISDSLDRQRELANRIRVGDAEAFEEVFLHYMPKLANFVYRYVGSPDEAQDIVQDIFLSIWRRHAEFRIHGSLTDYLYLAARNRIRDRFNHQRVVRAWEQLTASDRELMPTSDDPHVVLEAAERHAAIVRTLAELPERRRAVCTLRWVNGLSYAEIAQRLGISEKTVNNQLDRGFRELKERLARR